MLSWETPGTSGVTCSIENVDLDAGTLDIVMAHSEPISGFKLELGGVAITGVSSEISRRSGFQICHSGTTVIGFSPSGGSIPPGDRPLVSVTFDGSDSIRVYTSEELRQRNMGLREAKVILDNLDIEFFLIGGALLGAIRDGNFIKWDWDVELGVFSENIVEKGTDVERAFRRQAFFVEMLDLTLENFKINVWKYDTKYTLWGLHDDGEYRKRKRYKFPRSFFAPLDAVEFLGETYNTPSTPKEFLSYFYGDWRNPRVTNDKLEYLASEILIKRGMMDKIMVRSMRLWQNIVGGRGKAQV